MSKSENRSKDRVSAGVTLFVVSAVQFLTPFMMSAVGVALPAIGREFSASAVQLGLIETVYVLAVSLLLLPVGRLGDIHGRKKVFIIGIVLFTLGTLLVSLSWSIEAFIIFRFIQGSGAAMITGTSVAILSSVFPPAKRGRAMGIIVACVYLGLSTGPVLSGFMVNNLGWRWIFYLAVCVEVAAFFMTVFKLKGEWAEARGEAFDWKGTLIYIVSLFCLILGALNQGEGDLYRALMVTGGLGIVGFLLFEYRLSSPILDVRLLITNRVFALSNIATMINYSASFGITIFFSLYLQFIKGYSPQEAGLVLIIQPVLQAVLSPFCGRLADRYPPARLATLGMVLCALGLFVATTISKDTPIIVVSGVLCLMGVGFGIFSTPNMLTVMGSVAPRYYGIASSLVATMRTMGMLTSMTIITLVFSWFMGKSKISAETATSFLISMKISTTIFCALCLIGVLCSLGRVRNKGGTS